ncbi:unnamed protein product [Arabidopsis halleri]
MIVTWLTGRFRNMAYVLLKAIDTVKKKMGNMDIGRT